MNIFSTPGAILNSGYMEKSKTKSSVFMDFIFQWVLAYDKEVKMALMGEGGILYDVSLKRSCLNGDPNKEREFCGYLGKEEMAMP